MRRPSFFYSLWSDQVHEPATPLSAEGVLVEFEDVEDCPAHTITAMSEYEMAFSVDIMRN